MGKPWKTEGYYPPGYEYKREQNNGALLLGIGMVLSLGFFRDLYRAVEALYEYTDRGRVLNREATAVSFGKLTTGHWGLYMPALLFLAAMTIYHYIYYRLETKSIYVMRRLPGRCVLLKSCVAGTLMETGLGAAALTVLYLLYYGIYLLVIPGECLP